MTERTQNWISIALFLIIALKQSIILFAGRQVFVRTFDSEYYGKIYSESRYVRGPKSIRGIGDDGLYAFAGYYYLFQGGDVSSVNFEHPPLGKYLIGVSIFLTGNERSINIVYFIYS